MEDDLPIDIVSKLLEQKVFLASGQVFGSEQAGWFRIVFSQSKECLMNGLERMLKVTEQYK